MHKDAHSISPHDGEAWTTLPFLTLEVDHMGALVCPIRRADAQRSTEPQSNTISIKGLSLDTNESTHKGQH